MPCRGLRLCGVDDTMNHDEWAERKLRETVDHVMSGGLNLSIGESTLKTLQEGLQEMAASIAEDMRWKAGYCDQCHRRAPSAKDLSSLVKALDEFFRLLKFAQGEPDRHTLMTADDQGVLKWLTDEELDELMEKVRVRKAAGVQPE